MSLIEADQDPKRGPDVLRQLLTTLGLARDQELGRFGTPYARLLSERSMDVGV